MYFMKNLQELLFTFFQKKIELWVVLAGGRCSPSIMRIMPRLSYFYE